MHRFVALTRAILIRPLMNPRTIEYGFSHSSASNFASIFYCLLNESNSIGTVGDLREAHLGVDILKRR